MIEIPNVEYELWTPDLSKCLAAGPSQEAIRAAARLFVADLPAGEHFLIFSHLYAPSREAGFRRLTRGMVGRPLWL